MPYLSGHGEADGNGSTGEDPDGDPEGGPDGTAHCASLYSGSSSVQGGDREGEYDYSSSCGGGEALEEGKSCYEEEQIPYRSASSNGGGSAAVTYSVLHRGGASQGGREREYYREQRNRPIPRTKTRQRNYSTVTNISDLAASTGDAGSDRGSSSPPPLLTTPKHPQPPVVPAVGSWLSRPPLRPLAGLGIGETLFPAFPSNAMTVTQIHSATTSPLHGTVAAVVDKTSCSISGSGGKRGIVVLGRNNNNTTSSTTTASGTTTTVIDPVSGSFIV